MVLEEVKFFTNDDVLVDIITLLTASADDAGVPQAVKMSFDGVSYVNTKVIPSQQHDPSSAGLPPTTQRSIKRNSTSEIDTQFAASGCGGSKTCGAIHVEEHGTAYAKPIDCSFAPFPPGVDCLLKEGKMMYEGQSVFIAASADISATAVVGRDADRRASYAFSAPLSTGTPLVLGWVMGDDEHEARKRIAAYMSPTAAAAALAARTATANEFLSTKVPQLNVTLKPKPDAPGPFGEPAIGHSEEGQPVHAHRSGSNGVASWDEHRNAAGLANTDL